MKHPSKKTVSGSAILWTVIIIALLSMGAVEVLRLVTVKYQNALQTATWQEALVAGESGVDLAITELRKSLFPMPNHAWETWNTPPGNGITSYNLTTVENAGFAGTPMTVQVNVDAPAELIDPGALERCAGLGPRPLGAPGARGRLRRQQGGADR